MKRTFVILLSIVALMLPQTLEAQSNASFFRNFHEKDNNPRLTLDIKPENILDAVLATTPDEADIVLKEGTWFELERKVTDSFGNVHVTYNQMSDPKMYSDYQLVLHFRPDGSLYYKNGTLVLQKKETSQNAKARKPQSRISAERAAVIATGSPMSETALTIANYKNEPRDAYKVKDVATLQYVYVDAYSGEVLYTIPMLHSLASWDDVKGNAVTLSANTSYNGLQELTMMQTDKGIILRDPTRNIITVDATNALIDRDSTNLPKETGYQLIMTQEYSDDVLFADKEELLNQQFTMDIKSLTVWLAPEMDKAPDSLNLRIFYKYKVQLSDAEDLINIAIKDITWTDDNGRKKCTYTFEPSLSLNTSDYVPVMELTIDGEVYFNMNIIRPNNKIASRLYNGKNIMEVKLTDVECLFDVAVDATQPAIDVHWAIQKIYDMYDDYYGMKSCNGEGAQIVNIVNPSNHIPLFSGFPESASAASAELKDCNGIPSYFMLYGMGVPGNYMPMTAFDVTAHEFTHNVMVGCGNNLLYQNESGALHEALADCMAMVAEDYLYGEPTWSVGENITMVADNTRNISDPWYSGSITGYIRESEAQPKYYNGIFWLDYTTKDPNDPTSDYGGVHVNSGVFNHLFYLLCEGAMDITNEMDETSDITPVGMDRMKDIIFHDMRYYNACLCDYAEIADNLLMTVEDLFGNDKDAVLDIQNSFLAAYHHVGMKSAMFPTGINSISTPLRSTSTRPHLHLDSNGRIVIEKDGRVYNIIGGRMK